MKKIFLSVIMFLAFPLSVHAFLEAESVSIQIPDMRFYL